MKLQFKHQKFQADAAKAVVDVFAGQPYMQKSYIIDKGNVTYQKSMTEDDDFTGWKNEKIVPQLTDSVILDNINKVQRLNQIESSKKLEGHYNLTIEMETGVGKTYTYIKTMFELNKHYGWSKFIIVVPSIAIREGIYKSLENTQEHFAEDYGKKIRFFIYNSSQLTEIDHFASDPAINVMIINSQAFNARSNDKNCITRNMGEKFRFRRPIDIIAKTNPIIIIDEPQSVEGKSTKIRLAEFNPLFTLRYSATHREDSKYNMVYRLDAIEAYNKRLVKRIDVKGITEQGETATDGYVYLEKINLSSSAPTATIEFDYKGVKGPRKVRRTVGTGFNLYENSNELEEYKNGYVISNIDGREQNNFIELLNGKKIYAGDVIGKVSEDQLRRIQIRETIISHINRERQLFHKGIKVLSLFFIDHVENYRKYEGGQAFNGKYADIFEEEYNEIVKEIQLKIDDEEYIKYLDSIPVEKTHEGYFSIDKKGNMTDSKLSDKKERISDDVDAYSLIMKNKELLLDRDPKKSPVRFIFSHSALREGWDNPNVFQICTLKQSNSEVRKRQEVGRGLRLCVNQYGERMDANVLGADVHNINVLTVIASESYNNFTKSLQSEISAAVKDRPRVVSIDLFKNKVLTDNDGNETTVDFDIAQSIQYDLILNRYIDKKGVLTEKYYKDKDNNSLVFDPEIADLSSAIINILDSVYDEKIVTPGDARNENVELSVDKNKLQSKEFKELWKRISPKSIYVVDFDTDELVRKSILSLNSNLRVSKIYFKVETGTMDEIKSKEELIEGTAFKKSKIETYDSSNVIRPNNYVQYDLIGKIVDETGLTRKTVVEILTGIEKIVFDQFKSNPEEFIVKASALINDEKATAIIQHITYDLLNENYSTDIFTEPTIKGKLNYNARKSTKNLYDHVVYDSTNERDFSEALDIDSKVAVYVKLPNSFYISTPVGRYNPDWAIAFYEGTVKHIYFVAETKGSLKNIQFREIERAKIRCAEEHFKAISDNNLVYEVVNGYDELMNKVMK